MKRPLIAITVFYIILIVLMHELGILDKIPKRDIAREATGITARIQGRIISDPEEKTNKTSFLLDTQKIDGRSTKGKVLVNIYFSEDIFSYGDIVEAEGKFFRLTPPSNPGAFNYKKYLSRKKIYSMLSVYERKNVEIIGRKASAVRQSAFSVKNKMVSIFRENLSPKQFAVISGIMLRERSGLSPYLKNIFIDAGVMHVLVVSGLHVGFISLIFFWILRNIFRFRKKIALALLIPAVFFYAMVAGFNPPVVRASIMTTVVVLSFLLSKNIDLYQSISIAALIILIINPLTLFGASFQMSFIATIGIVYLAPKLFKIAGKAPRILRWPATLLSVSLSAQISISILMAYYFNKVSLIAIISNLIIPPMICLVLISGFILCLSSFISTGILLITAKITGGLISLIIYLVDILANIPYSTVMTITPSVGFMVLYYILVIGIPKFKNYMWKWVVIVTVGIISVMLFLKVFPVKKPFSITFINVGLGDAVYCEYPNGLNMLIDGGGTWDPAALYNIGETVVTPVILHKGRTSIDTVVLTHPHMNHYQGLLAIVEKFRIHKFITTEEVSREDEYQELLALLKKKEIFVEKVKTGITFENGPVRIKVLNPEKITKTTDRNSLVMKMVYDEFSILFCGDSTRITQNILTEKDIASTVLFVPSHGKKRLLRDFLVKTSPEFAIISTDNPSRKVLEQLEWCKLFTTSDSGAITIETDGKTWKIKETLKGVPLDMIILK